MESKIRRVVLKRAVTLMLLCLLTLFSASKYGNRAVQSHSWGEYEILYHLRKYPSRAFFADLFRLGGFRSGIEVGVADGRFSEHFLKVNQGSGILWYMVEPYPNQELSNRFYIGDDGTADFSSGTWSQLTLSRGNHLVFLRELSTDVRLLRDISDNSIDFIYLDGAHDYKTVLQELPLYYRKVRAGGVLAGHDYCNRGEASLSCLGCESVPRCGKYISYGVKHGKPAGQYASNQAGVVRAVHEWLVSQEPALRIHYTKEDFTSQQLKSHGMEFELVVTNTLNPSWYVVKPS